MRTTEVIQREYYERTAHSYDAAHVRDGDEHYVALRHIAGFFDVLGISSVLDVGCGTGRGVKYFLERRPGILVLGVEPVGALIDQAVHVNSVPPGLIMQGVGEALPIANRSFRRGV